MGCCSSLHIDAFDVLAETDRLCISVDMRGRHQKEAQLFVPLSQPALLLTLRLRRQVATSFGCCSCMHIEVLHMLILINRLYHSADSSSRLQYDSYLYYYQYLNSAYLRTSTSSYSVGGCCSQLHIDTFDVLAETDRLCISVDMRGRRQNEAQIFVRPSQPALTLTLRLLRQVATSFGCCSCMHIEVLHMLILINRLYHSED
jgi:hypothetical protein